MSLLIQEPPLQVLPSLAQKIGLNEAIVLQQIHYWQLRSKHLIDGNRWVYNSAKQWQEQFPFWSEKTIVRTLKSLRDQGLVITANYNKMKMDRTLWYAVNPHNSALGQNDHMLGSNCPKHKVNMTSPIPETTTETTTEIKTLSDKPKKAQLDWSPCPDLTNEDIAEIKTIRGKNKLTQRVVNSLCKEINLSLQAGATIDNILTLWGEKGWRAYKHEWAVNATQANQPNNNYQANQQTNELGRVVDENGHDWVEQEIAARQEFGF